MNTKVDAYFNKLDKWQPELEKLRMILLDCMLEEDLKWGSPCYSYHKNNISIIGGLKDTCVLSFFKGVLLSDSHKLLVQPGENTQSARIIPFTNVQQIEKLEPILKAYIFEAIEIEKSGLKVPFKKPEEFDIPEEFQKITAKNSALKSAFESLTPGRQRAYLLFFSAPKQSQTRISRIEKYIEKIMQGKGLND
ncbi:MAG: YdeI/OmpD-associated family protein [Bacteroidetes bacterium]|nr:YdeI/OmpD-associated family protein [Bacteroidota bacterium]